MKRFLGILILSMAAILAPTVSHARDLKFIFVSHGQADDPFWSILKNGAFQAGRNLGVQVEYRAPQTFDMVQMGNLIDAAVNQKPDGLIVSLPDPSALGPSLRRAAEAGIPFIVVNSGEAFARKLGALLYIGQDEALAGKLAGERLKALGGKRGICVDVEPGNVTLDIRCRGFEEGFGGPVKIVYTSLDPTDVEAKVRAALQADPSVDAVLTTSALIAGEPSLKAIAESGREGKVNLATFDLSPGMLKAVADGQAVFCIDQQEYMYGYLPVVLLKLYDDVGTMPVNDILTGPRFITQSMAAQVIRLSAKGVR